MMVASDAGRDRRQVAILDMEGRTAAWTGTGASDWKGHRCGRDYCAQGNILVGSRSGRRHGHLVRVVRRAAGGTAHGRARRRTGRRAGTRAACSRAPSWWWRRARGAGGSAIGWWTSGWTTTPGRWRSCGGCSTSSAPARWCAPANAIRARGDLEEALAAAIGRTRQVPGERQRLGGARRRAGATWEGTRRRSRRSAGRSS